MRTTFATLAGTVAVASSALGTAPGAGEVRAPATFMYILMVDMIGPAANSLWAAAAAPTLNDQDWVRLKQTTARLTESAHSVSFGGTTAGDIERSKSNAWAIWSARFADSVSLAAHAVERRDKQGLVAVADDLLKTCEGCHVAFPQTPR